MNFASLLVSIEGWCVVAKFDQVLFLCGFYVTCAVHWLMVKSSAGLVLLSVKDGGPMFCLHMVQK